MLPDGKIDTRAPEGRQARLTMASFFADSFVLIGMLKRIGKYQPFLARCKN